jgi:predicted ABC-type exoprotein transport system permease subunit
MGKLLMLLSCMSLIILAVGTAFAPNNQLFLLASDSSLYQYVREALAATLLLQFVTHPPRHIIFRLLAGMLAVSVAVWVIANSYNGVMPLLDTLSLLASASAIGVTALEIRPETKAKNLPENSTNPLIA